MAERRWEVPLAVAKEARVSASKASGVDAARLRDLGSRMPVGQVTFLALLASGVNGQVGAWASRMYAQAVDADSESEVKVLTAAGIGSVCEQPCYGMMVDIQGSEVVVAVVRASADGAGIERFRGGSWEPVPVDMEPVGIPYVTLSGDVLIDALGAVTAGSGLVLRAARPKAFIPRRVPLTASAGALDGVYAVVDEADTTAVLDLLKVEDGAHTHREDGTWVPDDGVLTHVVASGMPLALIPKADIPGTLRAFDDYAAVYPDVVVAAATATTPDFSTGVMIALPVEVEIARTLELDGGLDPAEMHVTLAYLGDQDTCPVDMDDLCRIVQRWAEITTPLSGEVSGPAIFEGGDDEVQVALVDVPGLVEARQQLVDALTAVGVPVVANHGYTAHITRAYGGVNTPVDGIGGTPLMFSEVGVWHGLDQRLIPLGSVTAAFNPSESRDPTGKWTSGGGAQGKALEATRKSAAPKAAPTAKTVVAKQHNAPSGGSASGASGKAVADKKAALRKATRDTEKAERDAEKATRQDYLQAYAAEALAEKQRRIDFTASLAGLSKLDRQAAQTAEQERRGAWSQQRLRSHTDELRRHIDALRKVADEKTALDAKLAKDLTHVKASVEPVTADAVAHTRTPDQLQAYWVHGKGAARVRWGSSGDWSRCVRLLSKYVHNEYVVKAQCNELHKLATGLWTSQHAKLIHGGNRK